MRDSIELESRGIPVALITATGRIPAVARRQGVYYLRHSHAHRFRPEALGTPGGQRVVAKMGYHRQLRMAGCRDGDVVDIGGTRLEWEFPTMEFEQTRWNWPAGFAKWHLTIDGIRKFRAIETPDPTVSLSVAEVRQRARELSPKVLECLTGAR